MKKVAIISILIGTCCAVLPNLNNSIMLLLASHSYISGGIFIILGALLLISDWNDSNKITYDTFDKTSAEVDSMIISDLKNKGYTISKKH
jgi:hypothetical protein